MAKILDEDFKEVYFEEVSIVEVKIPSISMDNVWTSGEGGSVPTLIGADIKQREIEVVMMTEADDLDDFYLLRSAVFAAYQPGKRYYLTLFREPAKRYRISLNNSFMPDRLLPTINKITLPFITNEYPYAESIIRSDYIDINGLEYDDIMTYGLGFSYQENEHIYRNTFSEFRIFNPGSVEINPVDYDMRIEIDNVNDNKFSIENKTTGDFFEVDKRAMVKTDKLVIDKAMITINNASAFRETNREFIRLAPGWNYFKMSSNANTFFNFRFYYD